MLNCVICFVQTARQHMIFLNAAGNCVGRSAETGREMGEHLIKCGFVETYQKMWRRHFNETMFNAEEADQILLYNLLVSLQVIPGTLYRILEGGLVREHNFEWGHIPGTFITVDLTDPYRINFRFIHSFIQFNSKLEAHGHKNTP